jgi:hypothetical protein
VRARALLAALLAASLAAGCGGDRPPEDAAPAGEGTTSAAAEPPPEPAEARELRERLRRESAEAVPDADPAARPPPPGEPAVASYADCMQRAAQAPSGEERALLESACRHLPGAP